MKGFHRVLKKAVYASRSGEESEKRVSVALFADCRLSAKGQHVLHGVQPSRAADQPLRRSDRATGECESIAGPMGELDALANARKSHCVVADDIAAAKHGKADRAAFASAGVAVT
jgi:hypothetical protein